MNLDATLYIVRNYGRFLVAADRGGWAWEEFDIHRQPPDFARLRRFLTAADARAFLRGRPEIEQNFAAWIVPTTAREWASYSSPQESRQVHARSLAYLRAL